MAWLTPDLLYELTGEAVTPLPVREAYYVDLPRAEREESSRRAEALLTSLLDRAQREQYATSGTFWVPLGDGSRVELGRPHHLVQELPDGPVARRVLCVVSDRYRTGMTPPADELTNLLLVAQCDPAGFLAAANVLAEQRRTPDELATIDEEDRRRRPERRLSSRQLAEKVNPMIDAGDLATAARFEAELGRRLARAGRQRLAVRCALPAGGLAAAARATSRGATVDGALDTVLAGAAGMAPWLRAEPDLLGRLLDAMSARHRRCLDAARAELADHEVATLGRRWQRIARLAPPLGSAR